MSIESGVALNFKRNGNIEINGVRLNSPLKHAKRYIGRRLVFFLSTCEILSTETVGFVPPTTKAFEWVEMKVRYK